MDVLFFVFFLILNYPLIFSKNIYVSTSGNDNNDGSESSPYKTILKASEGVYYEHVDIRNGGSNGNFVHFTSHNGRVVIDGTGVSYDSWKGLIHVQSCDYVKISGIDIENSPTWGIRTILTKHFVVEHVNTFNTGASGIWVEGEDLVVQHNTIDDANMAGDQEGLSVAQASGFIVMYNTVLNTKKESIDAKDGVSNGIIAYNDICNTYPYYGSTDSFCHPDIYLDSWENWVDNVTIAFNKMHDTYNGVQCKHSGITLGTERAGWLKDIEIYGNYARCSGEFVSAFSTLKVAWTGGLNDHSKTNINIHHNYFESTEASTIWWQEDAHRFVNFRFTDNILVGDDRTIMGWDGSCTFDFTSFTKWENNIATVQNGLTWDAKGTPFEGTYMKMSKSELLVDYDKANIRVINNPLKDYVE